ncbi:MAG: hypothetical protein JW839_22155 [Candidatus Lokiarchaeota archaeon]|nr:hypothetical protein [Candidatus Lokiarchaeota archaeon]
MAVPFLFFPGLTAGELIAFEILQTGLNVLFFVVMTWLVTWAGGRIARNRPAAPRRPWVVLSRAAVTAAGIELSNVGVAFSWYVLVLSVLVGLVALLLLFFGIPFFIMYLRDYRKGSFPEWRVVLHYVAAYVPALVASMALAWCIFVASGVDTYFVFSL